MGVKVRARLKQFDTLLPCLRWRVSILTLMAYKNLILCMFCIETLIRCGGVVVVSTLKYCRVPSSGINFENLKNRAFYGSNPIELCTVRHCTVYTHCIVKTINKIINHVQYCMYMCADQLINIPITKMLPIRSGRYWLAMGLRAFYCTYIPSNLTGLLNRDKYSLILSSSYTVWVLK